MTLEELESESTFLTEKINELEQRVDFLHDKNCRLISLIVGPFEELAKDRKVTETVRTAESSEVMTAEGSGWKLPATFRLGDHRFYDTIRRPANSGLSVSERSRQNSRLVRKRQFGRFGGMIRVVHSSRNFSKNPLDIQDVLRIMRGTSRFIPMNCGVLYKRTVLFVIALAVMPLLFGNAFHCLVPGAHASHHNGEHPACCAHDGANGSDSLPTPEDSCLVCDFLAMPGNVAPAVDGHCVLDLVERHEPEPVRLFVVLYCPFEPGRAPPTVV